MSLREEEASLSCGGGEGRARGERTRGEDKRREGRGHEEGGRAVTDNVIRGERESVDAMM